MTILEYAYIKKKNNLEYKASTIVFESTCIKKRRIRVIV